MKFEFYADPSTARKQKLMGVRSVGDNGNVTDYKYLPALKFLHWYKNVYPQLVEEAKSRGEPVTTSVSALGMTGDSDLKDAQVRKLREDINTALNTGDWNYVFSPTDKENPIDFRKIRDTDYTSPNNDVKEKWVPVFGPVQSMMYNLGSDFWNMDKDAFRAQVAAQEDARANGETPMEFVTGTPGWMAGKDMFDIPERKQAEYISKIFGNGAMSEADRELFLKEIAPTLGLTDKGIEAWQKMLSNYRVEPTDITKNINGKDVKFNTLIDLNTGKGSAATMQGSANKRHEDKAKKFKVTVAKRANFLPDAKKDDTEAEVEKLKQHLMKYKTPEEAEKRARELVATMQRNDKEKKAASLIRSEDLNKRSKKALEKTVAQNKAAEEELDKMYSPEVREAIRKQNEEKLKDQGAIKANSANSVLDYSMSNQDWQNLSKGMTNALVKFYGLPDNLKDGVRAILRKNDNALTKEFYQKYPDGKERVAALADYLKSYKPSDEDKKATADKYFETQHSKQVNDYRRNKNEEDQKKTDERQKSVLNGLGEKEED